jgi:HK97 family phage major capsid protein
VDTKELETEIRPVFDKLVAESEEKLAKIIPKRFVPTERTNDLAVLEDKKGGFKSFGHYLNDLIIASRDKSMSLNLKTWDDAVRKTAGYMEEGDLSQGGYLVPEEFSRNILSRSLEESIVRPRANIQPMISNRITFAADVDNDHSTDYFGGVTIYRTGEGNAKTPKNPTYARISLTLHKVTGLCHVTDELLEDSFLAVEADVTRKFAQAISFVQDDDFLNGTGVNMPVGVLNGANPALITVDAIAGQGAATIIAENIRDMWARMYPAGQSRAIWVANIETFPQLYGMAIAVGAGGVPVWMPANSVAGQPYQTLMGRPLIFTEKCQALGTAGDIALIDFSQYKIGEKGGLQVATSIHFKFDYDEQSFRFVLRYDGAPTWLSALTPKRGSKTLSPFVVLSSTRT